MAGELTCRGDVCADIDVHAGELVADLAGAEGPPAHLPRPVPLRQYLLVRLREAIQKKSSYFRTLSEKWREGVGPNPHFYIRIIWDPTLREGGAKLLFPKSKFHLAFVLGVISKFYSDLSLKNKENFCFSCRIFGDLLLQRTNLQ